MCYSEGRLLFEKKSRSYVVCKMSDGDSDEFEYEYDSDEDYDYGSDAEDDEDDVGIEAENMYYEAEDCQHEEPKRALELFERVVELETKHSPDKVRFKLKALERIVLIHATLGNESLMTLQFGQFLGTLSKASRNEQNEGLENILYMLSKSETSESTLKVYEMALSALREAKNERLWRSINLKLAKIHLSMKNYPHVRNIVQALHDSVDAGDVNMGNSLLEVLALEIELYSKSRDNAKLKETYLKTLGVSALNDPRIMGGVKEAGGKMYMESGSWNQAYDTFFEAFRCYQESGNPRAKYA